MAEEANNQDPQGQSPNNNATPDPSTDGQSNKETIEKAQDDLPEKFKGKSAKEIAESYLSLEKKAGEHSTEVSQARQSLQQWEALGKVIQGNPALEKLIVEEIGKISGKSSEDSKDGKEQPLSRDDTRIAVERTIVREFEGEYGIDKLATDDKGELQKKIGKELEEMLDPKGTKSASQLITELPLDKLPNLLRKAYKLATADNEKERARVKGLVEARNNRDAEFGTIPSSSTSSSQQQLNAKEMEVAKKLNITPEKYLKNKQELAKEQ